MGRVRRVGDPARNLFHVELTAVAVLVQREELVWRTPMNRHKTEAWRRIIAVLDLTGGKVDRSTRYAAGCPGLETRYFEIEVAKTIAQRRTWFRHSAAFFNLVADVEKTAQESSCRQNYCIRIEANA